MSKMMRIYGSHSFFVQLKKNVPVKEYSGIVNTIRMAVSKSHGLSFSCVCLVDTKTIIKTTSGKISRAGCRKAYLNDSLSILYRWEGSPHNNEEMGDESVSPTTVTGELKSDEIRPVTSSKGPSKLPRYTKDEIQSMEVPAIMSSLETTLIDISSQGLFFCSFL